MVIVVVAAALTGCGGKEQGNSGVTLGGEASQDNPDNASKTIAVVAKGKNALTGLPERFEITSTEVYEAIKDVLDNICNAIREVLNKTDPDLVADVMNDGLYLAGGGSKLLGFPQKIEQFLGVKVHHLDDPAHSVVKGAAVALKKSELIKNVDYQMRTIKELEIE